MWAIIYFTLHGKMVRAYPSNKKQEWVYILANVRYHHVLPIMEHAQYSQIMNKTSSMPNNSAQVSMEPQSLITET